MAKTLEEVYEEVMGLPEDSKECLAERLTEYLATRVDPAVERSHLELVRWRHEEIRSGKVAPVDGEAALAEVRRLLD